ncbi:MAG: hydrolase [Candidatus Omnitrophica bacterium]|nr:hydrolase [Candidatus Omnitrophota bacterium]
MVVVDVQGNLADQMAGRDALYRNIIGVIKAAKILQIPILVTEQAPDKIGPTVEPIKKELDHIPVITKYAFSCCGEIQFLDRLIGINRKQIVLTGIESHVCVIQTALDLIERGCQVQVIADAVSSRKVKNHELALQRMRMKNVDVTSTEMIVTEWTRSAQHPEFKRILSLIK